MLSNLTTNNNLKIKFNKASLNIVDSLLSKKYFNKDMNYPALLLHATANFPANSEVDTSLIYADYYLIEVLLMQLGYISQPI